MPSNLRTKLSTFLAAVLFFTAAFALTPMFQQEASVVQASFLDIISALVAINPLGVNVIAPAEAEINKSFKVEAVAKNNGEDSIKNAKAEIFLPAGLVLTQRGSVQTMGVIQGKRQKSVSWLAQGANTGAYIILVVVSGELRGEVVSAEGTAMTTLVTAIAPSLNEQSSPAGSPFHVFQVFFETFQRWLKL